MKSTMQEIPFSVARILEYGATAHRNSTVTTYLGEEPDTSTFESIGARAAAVANALRDDCSVEIEDRIATFLPNMTEHLEVLLGAASMGAIFHPLNRQLTAKQIAYVINHAEDKVIVCEPRYASRLIDILEDCPTVETLILTGVDSQAHKQIEEYAQEKLSSGVQLLGYEDLLNGKPTTYPWPQLPETAPAAICYSTGTAGPPKGVVYSHRSLWIHSMGLRTADSFGVRNGTPFLCCVPIYHVLSWGVPLAAYMCGAPMIFTGYTATPEHLAHVIADAMPRQAHGSSTVWTSLILHYEKHKPTKMSLQEIYSGGSNVPPALIDAWEERYGVDMIHSWGMTETGPVGTVAHPPAGVSGEARANYRYSQGRFPVSLDYRIMDDDGQVLENNDRNSGELQVRGNTVAASYYDSPAFESPSPELIEERFTSDGWLRTGDIGTVSKDGFLRVHDRRSDVIRSGGEWIYSAALESYLLEAPAVAESAVIGIPDDKWGQRPLAVVALTAGIAANETTARTLYEGLLREVPRWMAPENWTFVPSLEKTSVEKIDKKELRARFERGAFDIIRLSKEPGQEPGRD